MPTFRVLSGTDSDAFFVNIVLKRDLTKRISVEAVLRLDKSLPSVSCSGDSNGTLHCLSLACYKPRSL